MAILSSPMEREYQRTRTEGKPAGTGRVFVQTETGCGLGMDLNRSDNAHTVKRRLQIALNVPVDGISLSYGGTVLKNNPSAIRKDPPLLLTRSMLHRSPVEILGHSTSSVEIKQLIKDIVLGIKVGVDPVPVYGGLGGGYFFRNNRGESMAILKPADEEPYASNNPKGFVGKALGQPGVKCSVPVVETSCYFPDAYVCYSVET